LCCSRRSSSEVSLHAKESARTITTDSTEKARCPTAGCENTTAKLAKHINELGSRILIYA
jgi:hypothetical protein